MHVHVREHSPYLGAGFGVFAKTFIKRYTWLGEYEGEILFERHDDVISDYAWEMYRNDTPIFYIDGGKLERSNWLRWLNCPTTNREHNVDGMYCEGRMLYITRRDVAPGQELNVYYGDEYAEALGIDTELFKDV